MSALVYADLLTADYSSGTAITNALQSDDVDAPTSLTATTHAGSIEFTWVLGEFWQTNGISELWESTSNDFATASKIWDGRASRVTVAKDDIVKRYYWVRVRTIGDKTSDTEPGITSGVYAGATDPPGILRDARFEYATDQTYWAFLADAFSGGTATGISISATGGVGGGYLELTGDSTTKFAMAKRSPPYRATTTQQVKGYVRWMRTGTLSSALTTDVVFFAGLAASLNGDQPATALNSSGGLTMTRADVNAVTVSQWQESSFTFTFSNVVKSSPQYPYLQPAIAMYSQCTGGTIRVDSFECVPI